MSEQRAEPDEEGAGVWWASLAGPIVAAGAAREARRSTSEVTRANARNAVNHALNVALVVVAAVAITLAVTRWIESADPTSDAVARLPGALWTGVAVGVVGSIATSIRGIRAARRGEVFRAPGTVPFVR